MTKEIPDYEARYSKDQLRLAVEANCSCGGGGPGEKDTCPACEVWHWLVTRAESFEAEKVGRLTCPCCSGKDICNVSNEGSVWQCQDCRCTFSSAYVLGWNDRDKQ